MRLYPSIAPYKYKVVRPHRVYKYKYSLCCLLLSLVPMRCSWSITGWGGRLVVQVSLLGRIPTRSTTTVLSIVLLQLHGVLWVILGLLLHVRVVLLILCVLGRVTHGWAVTRWPMWWSTHGTWSTILWAWSSSTIFCELLFILRLRTSSSLPCLIIAVGSLLSSSLPTFSTTASPSALLSPGALDIL